MGVAGEKRCREDGRLDLVVEGQRPDDRQVAVRVVVSIEERELLRTMGRIVGRIQINRDKARAAAKSPGVVTDNGIRKPVRHHQQVARRRHVLKP